MIPSGFQYTEMKNVSDTYYPLRLIIKLHHANNDIYFFNQFESTIHSIHQCENKKINIC